MSRYLVGIDAGSTSSKVVIFDEYGNIKSMASTPSMRFKARGVGFEEFDVDGFWNLISTSIKEAIVKAEIDAKEIAGIGVTSFGNGVCFLGKNGEAIAPGALSQDYRANAIIEQYKKDGIYDKISEITKGALFAGSPAPVLRWYKENDRETYDKIGGILQFKDLVMYRLTEVFATDLNVIGGSFMVDMETMEYSEELMELYGIPEMYDKLPQLATEPTQIVGTVTKKAAQATGLAEGTPVAAGMMDILACLVGSGATEEGVITAIGGTWCINETHSDQVIPNASGNMPYIRKGEYLNCSYTGASGSNYEWFTKILGGTAKMEAKEKGVSFYDVLNEQIASVPIEKASVIFQPFVAQPSIHPEAKGSFINVDQNTTYAEMAYAVAEGVGFIHKRHIDFLIESGLPAKKVRFTGGIAKSNVWSQIISNILKLPLEVVDCDETGALGVALAAGIGVGVYKDYEEAFEKAVKISRINLPDETTYTVYDKRYEEWEFLNHLMTQYWDKK